MVSALKQFMKYLKMFLKRQKKNRIKNNLIPNFLSEKIGKGARTVEHMDTVTLLQRK